jgi:Mce-associated membrane protein
VPGLVLALVVALVALVLVGREWDQAGDRSDDVGHAIDVVADPADEAEAAAREAAVRMTTYDFQTLEEDFSWIDQVGTERFRKDFTRASKPVQRAIRLTRTEAEGEVMASAVRLVDETHATVVLFVDQLLVDRSSPEPKLDPIRLRIKLVEDDGRWLVDRIESFG